VVRKAVLAALVALLPGAAVAEQVTLTFGVGAALRPSYFGSDDYSLSPVGRVTVDQISYGGLTFGSSPRAGGTGGQLSIGGSFRLVGGRSAASYPELTGLESIDRSVELGLSLRYNERDWRAYANVRYGVTGHNALVGELGADVLVRPTERITLFAGPRATIGSDRYTDTYFGVTPDEAAASGLAAYDPDGGLVSAGVEMGMNYRFNDEWAVRGAVGYARLVGDAGDSPITGLGSRTQGSASLMLTRRMTFGF
jgi:MipA family protein